jgi:23S rRNA (adenine2030-N6)-methyltransferase
MPYEHFGKVGDVWKHFPLCSLLSIERPTRYIESNAAYPEHWLKFTPETDYGVGTVLRRISLGASPDHHPYLRGLQALQVRGQERSLFGISGMGHLRVAKPERLCLL